MNSQFHSNEPDPDAIKMFAGQIPRYWDENDLQKLFEEFGPVYQINVLRDKLTNQSKGCCFVTFYTRRAAMEAQSSLHNIKTLPGMQHPIQMKPADSEKRVEERKLFVGMLSKKCSETDVRMMFAPYGTIEECTILREQNGQSRGCAFVTLSSRQCAQNAIRGLHHSRTLEGCRSPLVVKLADSQKDKEMKRLQQMQAQLLNGAGAVGLGALSQALLQQSSSGQNSGLLGNLGNLGLGLNALQMQQILSAAASASLPSSLPNNFGDSSAVGTLQSLQNLQNLAALAALAANSTGMNSSNNSSNAAAFSHLSNNVSGGAAVGANNGTGLHSVSSASSGVGSGLSVGGAMGGGPSVLNNHGTGSVGGTNGGMSGGAVGGTDSICAGQGYSGMQQYGAAGGLSGLLNPALFSNSLSAQSAMSQLKSSGSNSLQGSMAGHLTPAGAASMPGFMPNFSATKQAEGPEGANLFIYHLPQEFNDYDLTQLFSPFGSVLSSKVYIDKQTNLSKCFGFVSYDNPTSAQSAIHAMNGYQIGAKRLKVHLKRPKNDPAKLY